MKKTLSALALGLALGVGSTSALVDSYNTPTYASAVTPTSLTEQEEQAFIQELRQKVGSLKDTPDSKSSFCSAVKIGPRLLLTAAHCVKLGGTYTFVDQTTFYTYEVKAIKRGDKNDRPDLALLRSSTPIPGPYAEIAKEVKPDQVAYAVGYPLSNLTGGNQIVTKGYVQGYSYAEPQWITSTTPLMYGNSGGGLFNSRGELLGITVAALVLAEEGLGHINHLAFSVHLYEINKFLN